MFFSKQNNLLSPLAYDCGYDLWLTLIVLLVVNIRLQFHTRIVRCDMGNISELERLISILLMREDAETIFSLLCSERDSVFVMEIIPYYALFVQSCQEYLGTVFLTEEIATTVKDIRNHIKIYSESFGKSKRKISSIDQEQDANFKSKLKFDFLKKRNVHLNLGTYWDDNHHVVGNTQQLAAFLDVKDISGPEAKKRKYELGYQISSFVASIRKGFAEVIEQPVVNRSAASVSITKYHDINTNIHDTFFIDDTSKELNLFFLHLLCNMNFVKFILRPMFPNKNPWVFRVEFIVTYYTFRALQRLKNYCDNNDDVAIDTKKISAMESIGNEIFQSKFRNCMMHYNLEDQGVLSFEHSKKPFYGIIETCFNGKDYQSYLASLHKLSDTIIEYLESHFNFSKLKLKQF